MTAKHIGAKIVSLGDWGVHGYPMTFQLNDGSQHKILLRECDLKYFQSMIEAKLTSKETPIDG